MLRHTSRLQHSETVGRMAEKQESAEATVGTIRRETRKKYSAEEKVRIVLEGLRGETSIAALCRREGILSNLSVRTANTAAPSAGARTSSKPASSAWWGTPSARQTAGR